MDEKQDGYCVLMFCPYDTEFGLTLVIDPMTCEDCPEWRWGSLEETTRI